MKLTVNVDQRAALRRGIDAPNSTAQIEVDPAALPPPVREWLATHLRDGHRVSTAISIVAPTVEGLVAAVEAQLQQEADERAKEEARAAADEPLRRAWMEYSERVVADPSLIKADVFGRCTTLEGAPAGPMRLTGEAQQVLLRVEREARERRTAEAEARARARRDALLDAAGRFGGATTRARFDAGYAPESEVEDIIRAAALRELGLEAPAERDREQPWRTLTDEQFGRLQAFRARLPEGAEVSAVRKWNEDEDDDDGRRTADELLVARGEWTVCPPLDVTVTAEAALD